MNHDYRSYLTAMLDELTSPRHPALRALTARTTDDPAIALLDTAAVLCDLLRFHGERIAEEGYLRTARDLASLGLLGRLTGYRPRPGLSASTHLAYTLDDRSATDGDVLIPRGSRSRSVPVASGEQPRTFETGADLIVRVAWNELPVRRRAPGLLLPADLDRRSEIYVEGTNTLLQVGDRLVFWFGDAAAPRALQVAKVQADPANDVTAISFRGAPAPSLTELVATLRQWISAEPAAGGDPVPNPRPVSPLITDFDETVLVPLRESLDGVTTAGSFVMALGSPLQRTAEAAALAAPYPHVSAWFEQLQAVIADLSARALELSGADPAASAMQTAAVETAAPKTSADDSSSGGLQALIAHGVTATPFGATAPLQPLRDSSGHVINLTDWPLPGATLTTVRVVFDAAGRTAIRAEFVYADTAGRTAIQGEFVYAQPESTVQNTVDLPGAPGAFNLGPYQVDVRGTIAEGAAVTLRTGQVGHSIRVSQPDANRKVAVQLDDSSWELSPGDRAVQAPLGTDQVTVRYAVGTQPASVEIGIATVPDQAQRSILQLDAVYDTITIDSWVTIERPAKDGSLSQVVTQVSDVRAATYTEYGTAGRGSQLTLRAPWLDGRDVLLSQIRDTTVYAAGSQLRLADQPLDEDLHSDRIELSELVDGLRPGRLLVVTGERTDIPGSTGVTGTELAQIAAVGEGTDPDEPADYLRTALMLTRNLVYRYRRATVRVLGNIVPASDGESRDEPIGSGDASAVNQTLTLWQEPLSWRPADNPRGAAPVLEIRVDGLLWHRVGSLAESGPADRVYLLGTAPDGRTTVTFGDGTRGARLPTGQENVRARYRYGTGEAGNLPVGRITQLVSRPLGVTGVTNPVVAAGGANPDGPGLARRRVPLATSALDRLLSVADYADFARSRVGIGRAAAREVYDGRRRVVHVTVAGVDDAPVGSGSELLRDLCAALARYGDPRLPVRVDDRDLVPLRLAAGIKVAPGRTWEIVGPELRAALQRRLGYPGRDLARDAYLSDVLAVAQAVPGVDYIDVTVFTAAGRPDEVRPVVPARPARYETGTYQVPASGDRTLTEVAAEASLSLAEVLRLNPGITSVGPLDGGTRVVTFRGVRPAQFTVLTSASGTLTLTEIPR